MKLKFSLVLLSTVALYILVWNVPEASSARNELDDDDDFAEFDDGFADDGVKSGGNNKRENLASQNDEHTETEDHEESEKPDPSANGKQSSPGNNGFDDGDDVVVEDDDFDGMDEDDFEDDGEGKIHRREMPPPKLTITSIPMPARGWQAYVTELFMMAGITLYMVNYIMGRWKNQKIAQTFFDMNWGLLEENFAMLGDSTRLEDDQGIRNYQKMSDSVFQMWCSGRLCCEGMLVELKLLKRQDLISILGYIFRPSRDLLRVSIEMGKDDMEPIVFAVATKKTAMKISKEYNDLVNFCGDKKPGDKFNLPSQLYIMTELSEVASTILDQRTVAVINKFLPYIDSIHFTDQFTGVKSAEPETTKDGVIKMPEPKRYLFFTFVLPTNSSGSNAADVFENMQQLMTYVFYMIDRMKRIKLSRDGKAKVERNRAKVEEAFLKQTHVARAEAAAARREEKRRLEKERILQEDDPDKQRRWEEKELKREKKKKQPKMKQLKVKAM